MEPVVAVHAVTFVDQVIPYATAFGGALLVLVPTVVWAITQIKNAVNPLTKDIAAVKTDIAAQGVVTRQLETNTNSISEKLRVAIEEGSLAKGNLEGRAELKAEQNAAIVARTAQHANAEKVVGADTNGKKPAEVKIVNPDPVHVKVAETK